MIERPAELRRSVHAKAALFLYNTLINSNYRKLKIFNGPNIVMIAAGASRYVFR